MDFYGYVRGWGYYFLDNSQTHTPSQTNKSYSVKFLFEVFKIWDLKSQT